jgi:hypothetical protein
MTALHHIITVKCVNSYPNIILGDGLDADVSLQFPGLHAHLTWIVAIFLLWKYFKSKVYSCTVHNRNGLLHLIQQLWSEVKRIIYELNLPAEPPLFTSFKISSVRFQTPPLIIEHKLNLQCSNEPREDKTRSTSLINLHISAKHRACQCRVPNVIGTIAVS